MRALTDGSTAIVAGAVEAGCNFFAGYPITPASAILMMMMREMPKVGGVALQAEDEIASIGTCIGAAMAGSRVMTATSGPGISLYSENVGLAIMAEVPLVIVDVQRLGPSTGGATTVGQGDVQFIRWGTAGGYPVIVLAPSSIVECHGLTLRAFDLAERFRCPVFLLCDKELNLTASTVDLDAFEDLPVRERALHPGCRGEPGGDELPPFRFEPVGEVAPMACYGEGMVVRSTGSTHDERGFITKDPAKVGRLNEHLAAKIERQADEIELVTTDLEDGAKTLLLSYGITAAAMREAVATLRAAGRKVSSIIVQGLWPVPEGAIRRAAEGVDRVVVAELNLGQYRREVERVLDGPEVVGLHRIDGELISPEQFQEVTK